MKKITIAFSLVLIAGFAFAVQAQTKKPSGIKDVDFKNFDYGADCSKTVLLNEDKLVLKNGHQGDELAYSNFDKVEYIDLNGDGKEEAFVVIDGQTGGSQGVYVGAFVFSFQKGSAKKIWSQCFERSDAKLQGKTIIFTRPVWLKSDPHCCFSQIATETYAWKGSKIALISTKKKKADNK